MLAFIITAVVAVWAVLLGLAYVCRGVLGLGGGLSIAVVACGYLAFACLALARFGVTGRGLLGIAGMGVPLLAACGLVFIARPFRRR